MKTPPRLSCRLCRHERTTVDACEGAGISFRRTLRRSCSTAISPISSNGCRRAGRSAAPTARCCRRWRRARARQLLKLGNLSMQIPAALRWSSLVFPKFPSPRQVSLIYFDVEVVTATLSLLAFTTPDLLPDSTDAKPMFQRRSADRPRGENGTRSRSFP